MNFSLILFLMVLNTLLGATGALLIKQGAERLRIDIVALLTNWPFIIGGCAYVAALASYTWLLQFLPLSIAYPLTSLTYVWVALASKYVLGEHVNAWRWSGIAMIICGIVLVASGA